MVLQVSNAAFSATTSNTGNSFDAGVVTLVDDDGGATAMFDLTGMLPGTTSTKCIQVSYTGSTFSITPVAMYASLANEVGGFASELNVTIEQGTGATFGNCGSFTSVSQVFNGTLASLASTHGTYANGMGIWTPTSGNTQRAIRVTVTLPTSAPNTAQGDSVDANFTWEVRSS